MPIQNPDYSDLSYDEMASSIGLKPKHIPLLVGSFLDESTSIMEALEVAIRSNDLNAIRSNAHSIKGSAGNMKFAEVYEMAKEMEHSAADANVDFDYKGYFEAIRSAIATIPK